MGVGNGSPSGVSEASSASDFYGTGSGTGGAVYSTWDFNGLWVNNNSTYPTLMWQGMGDGSGFTGGTPLHPFQISNVNQLQFMEYDLSGYFALDNNIDASATSSWNSGEGFVPIGNSATPFTGNFNGNNYTISDLFINLLTTNDVGLFGYTNGVTIQDVGLTNMNITGQNNVGALVGYNNSSSINNSYSTGTVSGSGGVGGLVGHNYLSSIANSYATGSVSGSGYEVGGLVGGNYSSSIDNSYATGNVSGSGSLIGGLVGHNYLSSIANSYATGSVSGSGYEVGGLVGGNYSSSIDNSYATGSASGSGLVGGLVGYNSSSSIANSYATGIVRGSGLVGGLVGVNDGSSSIANSYATGSVSGTNYVGGLVGYNNSSNIDNSYATGTVSGNSDVGGLVGHNLSSSTISNSFATGVATSSGDTAGGLIGNDDGTNTLTNNWWYNAINTVGVGNSSPSGVNEAGAASDFFSSSQAVYNGSTPWDFSNIWLATGTYPVLRWNYDIWIGSGDWSVPSNWSKDIVPTVNTNVAFAGLSTNDSTIDTGFGGDIANLAIFPNYTGTITQDTNLTISGDYIQGGGAFVSDPTKTFTVGNSFSLLGGTFNRFTGTGLSNDPYVIYDIYGLQGVSGFLSSYFSLNNNINASVTSNWNSGAGFMPIGNSSTPFTGTFNGNSYTISNLLINFPSMNSVSLFGYTSGATIENVGLENVNIIGANYVGGLVGWNNNSSSIDNSYATGSVSGGSQVGGLVGFNENSNSIDNSYAVSNVSGYLEVGGLVGGTYNGSNITNSYATGNVSGYSYVGGLVGFNFDLSSISNSYATGSVSGSGELVGGLVGSQSSSTISNSYASGNVSASYGFVGGLVGGNYFSNIDNSYATGSVSGGSTVGGLVGYNSGSSSI